MRPILETLLPHAYRYALRLTRDAHAAEDLAQEAVVRAWQHMERFNDDREARIWVLRVVANLWRDELRRREVRFNHQPALAERAADHGRGGPSDELEIRETTDDALAVLDRLPERQREVLYLTACEGLAPGEIGSVLGVSARAVIASLSIARQKVRKMIERRDVPAETPT